MRQTHKRKTIARGNVPIWNNCNYPNYRSLLTSQWITIVLTPPSHQAAQQSPLLNVAAQMNSFCYSILLFVNKHWIKKDYIVYIVENDDVTFKSIRLRNTGLMAERSESLLCVVIVVVQGRIYEAYFISDVLLWMTAKSIYLKVKWSRYTPWRRLGWEEV
jgi:hypothetical protein